MAKLMDLPVDITDKALEEIRDIINNKNIPEEYGLRLGIKGGGCAGVSFLLGFDKPSKEDKLYQKEGLQILISNKHLMHLIGLKLDFYDGSDNRGFMFSNPSESTQKPN